MTLDVVFCYLFRALFASLYFPAPFCPLGHLIFSLCVQTGKKTMELGTKTRLVSAVIAIIAETCIWHISVNVLGISTNANPSPNGPVGFVVFVIGTGFIVGALFCAFGYTVIGLRIAGGTALVIGWMIFVSMNFEGDVALIMLLSPFLVPFALFAAFARH